MAAEDVKHITDAQPGRADYGLGSIPSVTVGMTAGTVPDGGTLDGMALGVRDGLTVGVGVSVGTGVGLRAGLGVCDGRGLGRACVGEYVTTGRDDRRAGTGGRTAR